MWGFTDKYSWLTKEQAGLPWDKNMKPKSAMKKMLKVLRDFSRDHRSVKAKWEDTLYPYVPPPKPKIPRPNKKLVVPDDIAKYFVISSRITAFCIAFYIMF